MLPNIHYQCYLKFKQALEQLQQTVAGTHLDALRLRQGFQTAQQFFQQQVVSLDAGDLEPDSEARVLSYQTEMSKQLRLLGLDVIFLQAARQPETALCRQQQMSDRLKTLIGYCDALLQIN